MFRSFAFAILVSLFTCSKILNAQTLDNNINKPVWISGATLHVGDGNIINSGLIGFEKGKIIYVGTGNEIRLDVTTIIFIDGQGKHVHSGNVNKSKSDTTKNNKNKNCKISDTSKLLIGNDATMFLSDSGEKYSDERRIFHAFIKGKSVKM